MKVLEVNHLCTEFVARKETNQAVKDVSFYVEQGKTLCIVGESGSGKSVTSLSIMGLLPESAKVSQGEVLFEGKNLLQMKSSDLRAIRGKEITMIFQEPMTSLNPVFTIGFQLTEVYRIHENISKKEAEKRSLKVLERVGISDAEKRLKQYPHELSGGLRQRVMIAMAIALNPKLLIADEPTTALDVTIQAQILELLADLKKDFDMGMIFITHDMGVVAKIADDVLVMYNGEIMERGEVRQIFEAPTHPYTKKLLAAVPDIETKKEEFNFDLDEKEVSI